MDSKRRNIPIRIAAILLCAVLFSAHLASGMFAKYTVGVSDSSYARAAKVDLKIVESEPLTVSSLGEGTYKFSVKNNSEVAFNYNIVVSISFPTSIVTRSFGDERILGTIKNPVINTETGVPSEDDMSYTFSGFSTLAPGSSSDELVFTFSAEDLAAASRASTNAITIPTSTGYLPITLSVSAVGIQVN